MKYCIFCGKELNSPEDKFCSHCGKSLKEELASSDKPEALLKPEDTNPTPQSADEKATLSVQSEEVSTPVEEKESLSQKKLIALVLGAALLLLTFIIIGVIALVSTFIHDTSYYAYEVVEVECLEVEVEIEDEVEIEEPAEELEEEVEEPGEEPDEEPEEEPEEEVEADSLGLWDDVPFMNDEQLLESLHYEARYTFEQMVFPMLVDDMEDIIIEHLLSGSVDGMREEAIFAWDFAARFTILEFLDEISTVDEMGRWDAASEFRFEIGLGDEHIGEIIHVEIDENTNAFIIQLLDTYTPWLSIYLGVAHNDAVGLRAFTLEEMQDFSGVGERLFVFCFVATDSRGSFYQIEGNREEFIDGIHDAMINLIDPMVGQTR